MRDTKVIVANGDRMMTQASVSEAGIELIFADGCRGVIPFADIPEIRQAANLSRIELPNPYEATLYDLKGEAINVPWDYARQYCDSSYRPRVAETAALGRQSLGARIRRLRKSNGFTQEKLAKDAGISRVTLVRIENGEQSPRYENIIALARALGVPPEKLLA